MKQVVVMFARLSAVDQLRELAEAELLHNSYFVNRRTDICFTNPGTRKCASGPANYQCRQASCTLGYLALRNLDTIDAIILP
jgi:hypothetical protein